MGRSCPEFRDLSWLFLALALLTVPIRWIVAWFVSVLIHETGHLLMLRCLSVPVFGIRWKMGGASIDTAPMDPIAELLSAAAGPVAGGMLMLAGRWFPVLAVVAFFHTGWNLLPLPGHDGWRILMVLLELARKIPCKPGQERVQ